MGVKRKIKLGEGGVKREKMGKDGKIERR